MVFQEPEHVVVGRGQVRTIGRMEELFPAKHYSFPRKQVYILRACVIMLKDDVSFHLALVTKWISYF
jgi:hypothetical protein